MKPYSFSPFQKNWKLIKKYILELDKSILKVQNFIDFKSPNIIILNHENDNKPNFYSQEQLIELGVLTPTDTSYQINVEKLWPGQALYNNFGSNLYIGEDILPQGYALFKDFQSYNIYSLDSVGDYYIPIKIQNGLITFQPYAKATIVFGLNILLSWTYSSARWYFNTTNDELTEHSLTITNWKFVEPDSNQMINQVCSYSGAPWTVNNGVLGCDLIYESANGQCEEIICDFIHETKSQVFDNKSQSSYTINTNINIQQLPTHIYFY